MLYIILIGLLIILALWLGASRAPRGPQDPNSRQSM
jgi:hypothetical protein